MIGKWQCSVAARAQVIGGLTRQMVLQADERSPDWAIAVLDRMLPAWAGPLVKVHRPGSKRLPI